ncbi:unnamed protein product [Scytosiphon promiscuus]
MAFAGVQGPSSSSNSGAVREALRHIRVRSHATLNPRTGDVQSATGYFNTKKGKRVCKLFFAMNRRTQELWKGKSEGLTFWCPPYKFDSVWMKDTLFLTERSDGD